MMYEVALIPTLQSNFCFSRGNPSSCASFKSTKISSKKRLYENNSVLFSNAIRKRTAYSYPFPIHLLTAHMSCCFQRHSMTHEIENDLAIYLPLNWRLAILTREKHKTTSARKKIVLLQLTRVSVECPTWHRVAVAD